MSREASCRATAQLQVAVSWGKPAAGPKIPRQAFRRAVQRGTYRQMWFNNQASQVAHLCLSAHYLLGAPRALQLKAAPGGIHAAPRGRVNGSAAVHTRFMHHCQKQHRFGDPSLARAFCCQTGRPGSAHATPCDLRPPMSRPIARCLCWKKQAAADARPKQHAQRHHKRDSPLTSAVSPLAASANCATAHVLGCVVLQCHPALADALAGALLVLQCSSVVAAVI